VAKKPLAGNGGAASVVNHASGSIKKWHVTIKNQRDYKGMILYRQSGLEALSAAVVEANMGKIEDLEYVDMMEEYGDGKYRMAFDNATRKFTKIYGGEAPDSAIDVSETEIPRRAKLVKPSKAVAVIAAPIAPVKQDDDLDDYKDRLSYKLYLDTVTNGQSV
jgi:hypothetical protein